jgi:hypothetical protein
VPIRVGGDQGHRLAAARGQHLAVGEEVQRPLLTTGKADRQRPGGDGCMAVVYLGVCTATAESVFSGNSGWRGCSPAKWLTAIEMTSGAGEEHRTVSTG